MFGISIFGLHSLMFVSFVAWHLFNFLLAMIGFAIVTVEAVRPMISLGHLLIVYQINISIVMTAMQFSIPQKSRYAEGMNEYT